MPNYTPPHLNKLKQSYIASQGILSLWGRMGSPPSASHLIELLCVPGTIYPPRNHQLSYVFDFDADLFPPHIALIGRFRAFKGHEVSLGGTEVRMAHSSVFRCLRAY